MSNLNQGVLYYNANYFNIRNGGVSAWQGLRNVAEDVFLLCGTTKPNPQKGEGIIYSGNISFTSGTVYYLNVPNALYTSVYGPNYNFNTGIYNFVGSYQDQTTNTKGFIYTGRLDELSLANPKNYSYPKINNTYDIVFVHSISNDYCVGNAGNIGQSDTLAFIYNINKLNEPIQVSFPGSKTTTVYGIWYNKSLNNYTIVGGFSPLNILINKIYFNGIPLPIGQSFLVDFNPETNIFTNWTVLDLPLRTTTLSHIQGISGFFNNDDVYSLSIDTINNDKNFGYYANVIRNKDFNFIVSKFIPIQYGSQGISSVNSVANNSVVGISVTTNGVESYQAVVIG